MRVSHDPVTRRRRIAVLGVALAALVVGILVGAGKGDGEDETGPLPVARVPAASCHSDMPLRVAVGQTLVLRFLGNSPPPYVKRRLRSGDVAGVILFGDNIHTPGQLKALTSSLQRSASDSAIVMTDQEGGSVRNVPWAGPAAAQPEQRTPGASAEAAAKTLRAGGINVSLAPVLDVSRGSGSALRRRTFSGGAAEVGRAASAAVRGWSAGRVAATLKHYPGLGLAGRNTDDAPVTITASRAELERVDLAPYRAAIKAGAPIVMAGHAVYTAYDRGHIASQSRRLLRTVLRGQLGFEGVVVTDSIEADAVRRRSGVETAALRSIAAGADMVLMSGRGSYIRIRTAVLREARRNRAFRCRVYESAERVAALRKRLGLQPARE